MSNEKNSSTSDRELVLTRILHAPVQLVWEAWSNPAHIANWWGPNGFTNTIHVMDFRPGGKWELVMHGPDGTDYDNKIIFREIVPLKKIVYEHITWPSIIATISFEDLGDTTRLHWHMLFESREEFIKVVQLHKADEGLQQTVERMHAYLSSMKTRL